MATEGFTGINTDQARKDIRFFDNSCFYAHYEFSMTMHHLFDVLSAKWASPKAVEFFNNYIGEILELSSEFRTTYKHIVSGAVAAATQLAVVNGTTFEYGDNTIEAGEIESAYGGYEPCKEELNGQVGMDVEGVKNALGIFDTEVKKVVKAIDSLPEGIAFYDPEGNMVGSYNRNIKDLEVKFTDLFNGMIADLKNAIESESDNILLAKQKATETMSA